jgi:hypothetical protein
MSDLSSTNNNETSNDKSDNNKPEFRTAVQWGRHVKVRAFPFDKQKEEIAAKVFNAFRYFYIFIYKYISNIFFRVFLLFQKKKRKEDFLWVLVL